MKSQHRGLTQKSIAIRIVSRQISKGENSSHLIINVIRDHARAKGPFGGHRHQLSSRWILH
jgi:hypothetical protein